uniref:C-type lectin domain-containing protein n=1 Tax=Anolis carolinensis TaxID=28377 RepID=A0A803TYF4_ANOCA
MTVIIILILAILFTERKNEGCPNLLPAVFADPCPKGWLGYQMKCYYFSVNEGNWTSGNSHCSSHNASLAVVGSQETLDFFLRYKSPPDHWIGLQKDSGQPWRWINGSIFTEGHFGQYEEQELQKSENTMLGSTIYISQGFHLLS